MKRSRQTILPVGKLPLGLLDDLLKRYLLPDENLVVGPGVGEDAAVIDTGGPRYLIAKTDPITFTADRIGWYAVHINANDIAAMGGRPRWFLAAVLLPEEKTAPADVERIFKDLSESCRGLGISLVGGHTEVTQGLDRPIIIGQMLGEVEKERLVRSNGAREGDAIILTKGVAIEGTAIIAREFGAEVEQVLGSEMAARCRNFMYDPGLSVVEEALAAGESVRVHAMHDPTEGGLATALHEVAWAAGVGVRVDAEAITVFPETELLCRHYHIDPLGLIASGALLIVVEAGEADKVLQALQRKKIPASRIGHVVSKSQGVKIKSRSGLKELPLFERDELTKISLRAR